MKRLFVLLVFTGYLTLIAQNRREVWTKLNTSFKINQQYTLGADWQYRTQSAYHTISRNPFDHLRMQSMRLWVYYTASANTNILLSPIAGFIISDYNAKNEWVNTQEIRHSLGIQSKFKYQDIIIKPRLLLEQRHFVKPTQSLHYRTRIQFQLIWPIIKKRSTEVGVILSEEYFYQVFEQRMDNNRMMAGIQLQSGQIEIQSGIQWQVSGTFQSGSNIFQSNTTLNCKF